jgi:hypothetical protein
MTVDVLVLLGWVQWVPYFRCFERDRVVIDQVAVALISMDTCGWNLR